MLAGLWNGINDIVEAWSGRDRDCRGDALLLLERSDRTGVVLARSLLTLQQPVIAVRTVIIYRLTDEY